MLTVPVGPELLNLIRLAYLSNCPVMLVGGTGCGKSEMLEQAAAALGIRYLVRDLSLMEGPDLAGLPIVEGEKTRYAAPSFLPVDGKGILAFEELNRAPRHVRAPTLQLLTARCLNDYILPAGWLPVAAINPEGEDYVDVETLDKALMARFMSVKVQPHVPHWLKWAEQNSVHPAVVEFVRNTPKIFDKTESNPRAWKRVSDILFPYQSHGFTRDTFLPAVAGLVGDKMATAFWSFFEKRQGSGVPAPERILSAYNDVRTNIQKFAADGNTALLESLVQQMLLHAQAPASEMQIGNDPVAIQNLNCLLNDLPAEFSKKLRQRLPKNLLRTV